MQKNIFFDLDSTLVTIEGLDFLASQKDKEDELKQITVRAMNGELSMQEAMAIKMQALSPSRADLTHMGHEYLKNMVPGAKESVAHLHKAGHRVWILTGNFQPAAGMLAKYLGIPQSRVITNDIRFYPDGSYQSFDLEHPLSNNRGKVTMLQDLQIDLAQAVMVGDGATDLDTQSCVGLFIGFGGVVERQRVREQAQVYVIEPDLRAILPYIMTQTTIR